MTNPTQTQVVVVVAVLASMLLSIDAASSTQSATVSITPSFSQSISVSGTVTNSFSPTFSPSVTESPSDTVSVGFTLSTSVTVSLSLSTSFSTSLSYSQSISTTFTASCTLPVLQDRCAAQVTVVCPFYALRAGICLPPASLGMSTFEFMITNSTGGVYTDEVTFPAGVTPQFPSSSISTGGFLHGGATYMFQVFQINTDGTRGLASNQLIKSLPPDSRDPSARCKIEACNQFCGTQPGSIVCSWTLGTLPLKHAVLDITRCFDATTFQQVDEPAVSHNRTNPGKVSSVSLSCQSRTLCFVKLTLRYKQVDVTEYGLSKGQSVSRFGVICG